MSGVAEGGQAYRNKLGQEKSPYLLQHANNPVNWLVFFILLLTSAAVVLFWEIFFYSLSPGQDI